MLVQKSRAPQVVFFHEVRELGEAQGCDCFGAAVAVLLRVLRERRGWTEAVAEERSGVRRQSIHNWEIGSQLPRMDRMGPLCQELGVQGWELHRAAAEIAGRMMQL